MIEEERIDQEQLKYLMAYEKKYLKDQEIKRRNAQRFERLFAKAQAGTLEEIDLDQEHSDTEMTEIEIKRTAKAPTKFYRRMVLILNKEFSILNHN